MKRHVRHFDHRKLRREVLSDIRRRLDLQGHDPLRRVRCDFSDGTLVLWGKVACEAERQLAADIVAGNPHVEVVENRLQLLPHIAAPTVELLEAGT